MSRNDLPNEKAGNFPARLRETVQTMLGIRGDKLDRVVTLRDLLENGLFTLRSGGPIGTGTVPLLPGDGLTPPPSYVVDLTPPPSPGSLTATAAISHIIIEVPPATYTQGNGHLRTRVYGVNPTPLNPTPTFSDAVEVGQFSGTVWALASNPATTWHLWAKWETNDGVLSASPVGGTNGVVATTGQDVTSLVEALTGPGNPFVILDEPTTIDGVLFPAGTYSAQAFIQDLQVSTAKIADLAVDDAKIASLSVSKLIAGSIDVGQYIQSTGYVAGSVGWRINGDGTAEFSGVVVRGTIYASAGLIGGSTIGSTYIRSNTYALNESGWNFNSDGTGQVGGIAFLTNAMQSSNFVAGSAGWRLTRDGTFEANSGIFRGKLHGGQFTTGQFTGYAWPASGGGSYLGPSGLLLGNANTTNQYFQVTSGGALYAPGFSVVGGVLTISQANVIGALQLANNAVSVTNFASGNNSTSTNVTLPPNVTADVFAIGVKASGSATGNSLFTSTLSLNIAGNVFNTTVYPSSLADGGGNVFFGAAVTGRIVVGGNQTITATLGFDAINGTSNTCSILLFARWK